ncbi:unnamed protein product [Chondrus crispus]|uniref:NADH dehydrogenase [ubiquinone] 1 alpha subcomplex subunit 1 n=1 Tax=Chondrus crispus TaxID=2769 RepID=R7QRR7_CHOCR|nr:unnamed protein product [Chondrus crispus]CDF40196.1 unnamed protein product [Chondrus crispus]|eukprot:XP_005710490.1 unnamed protein product [Chondrus crispus]
MKPGLLLFSRPSPCCKEILLSTGGCLGGAEGDDVVLLFWSATCTSHTRGHLLYCNSHCTHLALPSRVRSKSVHRFRLASASLPPHRHRPPRPHRLSPPPHQRPLRSARPPPFLTMTWLEAMPPLIIITGALAAMGSLQAAVHRGFNDGKNKKVQRDYFSHLMDKRDKRIREEVTAAEQPDQ